MASNRDDFGIAIRYALLQKGAKHKFSLFFLICISILIFFLDSFSSNIMSNVRSILNDSIYRVSAVSSSPFNFLENLGKDTKNIFFVLKENKYLKAELRELKKRDFQTKYLTNENKRLKEVLDSKNDSAVSYVLTKVLLDKKSPFLKSIILNKGRRSGIVKGMPVISKNYLIGKVVEANYLSSRVLLLNDLNSRIPVTFGDRAVQSILTGIGRDKPRLEYLPENFEALDGETVFTSGKDGILTPGLPIGLTENINNKLDVKLFANPNQLSFVKVILIDKDTESNF